MTRFLVAAVMLPLLAPAIASAEKPSARVEIPIREVVLPNGVRRYAITIRIAGAPVEVGLDTGSTGLRVLPRALPPAALKSQGRPVRISYNGGTRFTGQAIEQPIGIGAGRDGNLLIQRIDVVDCREEVPQCDASRATGDAFGIEGEGIPGQGFAAIMGIGLKTSPIPNPLRGLGIRRWIVDLPRPDGGPPGRLVLNPDDSEIADYRHVKMADGEGNHVTGCLALPAPEEAICGQAEIDTGAPGMRIVSSAEHDPVPPRTAAALVIGDPAAGLRADILLGQRDRATRLRFETRADARQSRLFLGVAPYLIWSILYDIEAREIGLKPR
ncbi:hypothetical protein PQ455_11530 [Sphingomonas naphthae]|uniref:Aspartyl protease n=1 Tax=Sphingomonas naphthae TaxID=1813468 RepID=A0ABY7TH46_9SPHN|nr:hypothetical protein [Sphingomonas naphthae]WCT72270.1 hypothetical protein PQ455_11530 [Sphingomonas naphthae]